jgi:hypothetical protein
MAVSARELRTSDHLGNRMLRLCEASLPRTCVKSGTDNLSAWMSVHEPKTDISARTSRDSELCLRTADRRPPKVNQSDFALAKTT